MPALLHSSIVGLQPRLRTPLLLRGGQQAATALLTRHFLKLGGVASGDAIVARLRCTSEQPISVLARWIVNRDVLVLPQVSGMLLPLFQFDFDACRVKPAVQAVLQELRDVFDDQDLASWFAAPNRLLADQAPVLHVDVGSGLLLEAARTDRFIATG